MYVCMYGYEIIRNGKDMLSVVYVCMYGRVKVMSVLAVSGGTVSVRGSGSVVYNLTITQAATLVRL